jgi:hypothetical protein
VTSKSNGNSNEEMEVRLSEPLKVLNARQILQVDRALASLGPFGEVRLVKVKGRLRFIERLVSEDLLMDSRRGEGD